MSGFGACHLCRRLRDVQYCPACEHYFCDDCRGKYWARGLEAVKQMVGGRQPGCCFLMAKVS